MRRLRRSIKSAPETLEAFTYDSVVINALPVPDSDRKSEYADVPRSLTALLRESSFARPEFDPGRVPFSPRSPSVLGTIFSALKGLPKLAFGGSFSSPDFGKDFFNKHQEKLVSFADSWIGRRFFGLRGGLGLDVGRVMALYPNAVSYDWKAEGRSVIRKTTFTGDNHFQNKIGHAYGIITRLLPTAAAVKLAQSSSFTAVLPLIALTTDFFPAAGASSPVDGVVGRSDGASDPTWASIRGTADGTFANVTNASISAPWLRGDQDAVNRWENMSRAACCFDTSAIGSDTVTAADFKIYVTTAYDNFSQSVCIVPVTLAGTDNLVVGDYDAFGTTQLASDIAISALSTSAYNTFSLTNPSGTVVTDDVTQLGMRLSGDRTNTEPAYANNYAGIVFYSADNGSNKPTLTVTHVSSAPEPSIYDSISVAELVSASVDLNPSVYDSISVAENIGVGTEHCPSVSDSIEITESVSIELISSDLEPSVVDSISIAELSQCLISPILPSTYDEISVAESVQPMVDLNPSNAFVEKTFIPDADPETSSVDGQTFRASVNETWANIVNGAGTGSNDLQTGAACVGFNCSTTSNQFSLLRRAFFVFDTSTIPDDSTVLSAVLKVYGAAKSNTYSPSIEASLGVYGAKPSLDDDLLSSDFNIANWGSTILSDITSYNGWNAAGYNDFTLNVAGLSEVSKTGRTYLGLRNVEYDAAQVQPLWGSNKGVSFSCSFAENADPQQRPRLVVTYVGPNSDVISIVEVVSCSPSLEPNSFDLVSISEHIERMVDLNPSQFEEISIEEILSNVIDPIRPLVIDDISIAEAVQPTVDLNPNQFDSVSVVDAPSASIDLNPNQFDTITVEEYVQPMADLNPSAVSTVTVTEAVSSRIHDRRMGIQHVRSMVQLRPLGMDSNGPLKLRSTAQSWPLAMDEDETR